MCFACLSALGQNAETRETRSIDFSQALIGYDHKPIVVPGSDSKQLGTPLTLRDVVLASLEMPIQSIDGQTPEPVAKAKRDYLAGYIFDHATAAKMSEEDLALIVARVKAYEPPVILGPAWKVLDPVGYERAIE